MVGTDWGGEVKLLKTHTTCQKKAAFIDPLTNDRGHCASVTLKRIVIKRVNIDLY